MAAVDESTSPGAVAVKRVTHMVMFLVLALLLAVVIEWLGMTFFWPEEGVDHSRRMVLSEYDALDLAVHEDAFAASWVASLASAFVDRGYTLLAQKSGVESLAVWLSQWTGSVGVVTYAESALNSIQAFLLRLVVVVLALPAFVLVAIMSSVEGLSRRALRRYGGGHETAYVFHHAKRALMPSVVFPAVLALLMNRLKLTLPVMMVLLIVSGVSYGQDRLNVAPSGDQQGEAAALIRIANEVARLKPLVADAQTKADPTRRFQVRYDWLLRDLDRIAHGLRDAAAGGLDTGPRDISQLHESYSH